MHSESAYQFAQTLRENEELHEELLDMAEGLRSAGELLRAGEERRNDSGYFCGFCDAYPDSHDPDCALAAWLAKWG